MKSSKKKGMRRTESNTGITLMALIITIIVLLILAGVSISMVLGENGVIKRAEIAANRAKTDANVEKIKISQMTASAFGNGTLDEVIQQLVEDGVIENTGSANKIDDNTAIIKTKDGQTFEITNGTVEYVNTEGMETPPNYADGNISYAKSPNDEYTNQDVEVSLSKNVEGNFTIQYSLDGVNYVDYSEPIKFAQNGTLYYCLRNAVYNKNNYGRVEIESIDKDKPEINSFTVDTTAKVPSKVLTIDATDSGVSGIKGYYIGTSSTEPAVSDFVASNTKTITANGTYYAWVIDKANNISDKKEIVESNIGYPTYSVGTSVPLGGYNFYVIGDSGDNVTLLCKTTIDWANWENAKTQASSFGRGLGGSGRLMTLGEALGLEASYRTFGNSYWLADYYGNIYNGVAAYNVNSDGSVSSYDLTRPLWVRPVVVISKSKL